jgi:tetratricopeptide (TPR) repeat protein
MLRITAWLLLAASLRAAAAEDECPGEGAALQRVADEHLRFGRLTRAELVTRNCIAYWTPLLPAGDVELISMQSYLGLVTMLNGHVVEAETLLQDSYRQAQASKRPGSIAAASAYLGSFYRYQNDTARALPLLRTAHRLMGDALGADAGMVGAALMEIGAVQTSEGRYALAKETFRESLEILQKNRMYPEARICEIYLAAVDVEMGRLQEAEPRLRRAIDAGNDASALAESTRTMALYHMARLYRAMKRHQDADRYYQQALAAYEKAKVPPLPHVSVVALEYSEFLKRQRRPEANSWAAKAKAWKEK